MDPGEEVVGVDGVARTWAAEGTAQPAFEVVVAVIGASFRPWSGLVRRRRYGAADQVSAHSHCALSLGTSSRSLASAFDAWLFTVPTEQPRVRAISASDMSS